MKKIDVAQEMTDRLNAESELNSDKFKLQIALECLNKAAICFDMADKEKYSEKITKIMEKLSKVEE
jgi:hypothetical protein